MRALIEPSGRVVQVETEVFPVAAPLRWVECDDDADPGTHYFDGQRVAPIPPPPPLPHNAQIEREIKAVYAEAPFTQRALTELAWSLCAIRDIQEQQITALVNVIREIGGPSYATFDVPRVPDLKRNKGMITVKDQIERTKALRAQKQ